MLFEQLKPKKTDLIAYLRLFLLITFIAAQNAVVIPHTTRVYGLIIESLLNLSQHFQFVGLKSRLP